MDSVNPASSAMSLFTSERTAQPSSPDEQNGPASTVQQAPNPPRVNEGPSTITTISPQAQQLAQQEQSAGDDAGNPPPNGPPTNTSSAPRNDAQQADRGDEQAASPPAEQSSSATPPDQSGRAFNDQSPNGLLRN